MQHQEKATYSTLPTIDVCYSPALIPYCNTSNAIIVVVDIIRASASICTALAHGFTKLYPTTSVEEALSLKQQGYVTAGERDSHHQEGFDLGNSPESFADARFANQSLAFTSTNGTQAIEAAKVGATVLVGSFLNFSSVVKFLEGKSNNVIFLCSGWKNAISVEDILFAGKVSQALLKTGSHTTRKDSTLMAITSFKEAEKNMLEFILEHSPRLKGKLSYLENDVKYCLQIDKLTVLPMLYNTHLVDALQL